MGDSSPRLSKGNQVNIPEPGWGYFYGNVNEPRDTGGSPGKSYLFLLTVAYRGIGLAGDTVVRLQKHRTSAMSGALPTVLENLGERLILPSGRTHNRIWSPR